MRVCRVFIPGARPGVVEVGGHPFHHVAHVLRRSVGDPVVVLDGEGRAYESRIRAIQSDRLVLEVLGVAETESVPVSAALTAAVAVPRGDGLEQAIRLASETGLAAVQPLYTERTVARPRAGSAKVERWRRIAVESAQQCRRLLPLEVHDPVSWADYIEIASGLLDPESGSRRAWIAIPGGPGPEEAGLLAALRVVPSPLIITVLIGPEGGFTPDELRQAQDLGVGAVGFPAPVLKTPTAVVYLGALAALTAP